MSLKQRFTQIQTLRFQCHALMIPYVKPISWIKYHLGTEEECEVWKQILAEKFFVNTSEAQIVLNTQTIPVGNLHRDGVDIPLFGLLEDTLSSQS